MFKATINSKSFEITSTEDGFIVNGKPFQWDLANISEGYFHVVHGIKTYRAEVVKADHANKIFQIKINGNLYPVEVKDKFDILLEKMGMTTNNSGKVNNIKAPMPGLIISLKVQQGDHVNAGDPLLILEAMKMENVIKSPGEGTVKAIPVKKGDSVEKNQVLIEFS